MSKTAGQEMVSRTITQAKEQQWSMFRLMLTLATLRTPPEVYIPWVESHEPR